MPELRFKTERADGDENFRRTQVDMPLSMISALDRICKRKCIQKRAELIRMYLAEAIRKEGRKDKNEGTKNGISGRPNGGSGRKRRAS